MTWYDPTTWSDTTTTPTGAFTDNISTLPAAVINAIAADLAHLRAETELVNVDFNFAQTLNLYDVGATLPTLGAGDVVTVEIERCTMQQVTGRQINAITALAAGGIYSGAAANLINFYADGDNDYRIGKTSAAKLLIAATSSTGTRRVRVAVHAR